MKINWSPHTVEVIDHPVETSEYKISLVSLAKIFYKEMAKLREKSKPEPIEFESKKERTGTDG